MVGMGKTDVSGSVYKQLLTYVYMCVLKRKKIIHKIEAKFFLFGLVRDMHGTWFVAG